MCKKSLFLICIVSVLITASASYGVVVGNWEYRFDGWTIWPSAPAITQVGHSTNGATLNSNSLRVSVGSGGWNEFLVLRCTEVGRVADFFANDTFSVDVTRLVADWSGPGWGGTLRLVVNTQSAGWNNLGTGLPNPGWWSPANGDQTINLSWDYSAVRNLTLPTDGWIEIIIGQNSSSDWVPPLIYYLDNAQLTPEPTTIALLGLGSLALLRKKRS
jgi:hypothetical protein